MSVRNESKAIQRMKMGREER